MQYDENAEKYGYEGEMMPLKCDKLKPIELECNMGNDINGVEHREPWKAYDIDEVDAAIAELKDVIHELQVDLEGAKATAHADSVDGQGGKMKCDKLQSYKGDVTIPVYGSIADAEVYLKEDADTIIATFRGANEEKTERIIELQKQVDELEKKFETVNELIKTARQMLEDAKATLKKAEEYK